MAATKEQAQLEFYMFQDIWTFYLKYLLGANTDDYWAAVIKDGSWIIDKYKPTIIADFCSELVMTVIDQFDRVRRTKND